MSVRFKAVIMSGAVALTALLAAPKASADQLSVGLGVGLAPQYPGADIYQALPFPSFRYQGEAFEIRSLGLGFEADVVPSQRIGFGPIVRLDIGRNGLNDVDDPIVALLPEVDVGVELGGFLSAAHPIIKRRNGRPTLATARVSATQAINGHEGFVVEGSIGLVQPFGRLTMILNASSTFASSNYNEAYFGIDAAGAAASGLGEFEIDGGVRDVGGGLIASYALSDRWSIAAVSQYSRLIGDAADSPIVQRGSEDQVFVGLNTTYRFR